MPHTAAKPASIPSTLSVAVIIPAFNEVLTIQVVLDKVLAQACVAEIIVIDDFSQDGTWEVISQCAKSNPRIQTIRHSSNRGKGAALRSGFALVSAPLVLIQDADLEYDPECYERLIAPILRDQADVVFGSRFLSEGPHRVLYFWHSLGNRVLTLLSNMMTNLNLTDMETCYKVFRSKFLLQFHLKENRFGIEPELISKLARLKPRIYEIGIPYYGRTYAEGKKITWRDGLRAIWCIIKFRFST